MVMDTDVRKFELNYDEYVKIMKLIENLRISLDRIGAIAKQGRDKMLLALDEYFSSEPLIYNEIKDAAMILLPKMNSEERHRIIDSIKFFELKKYD